MHPTDADVKEASTCRAKRSVTRLLMEQFKGDFGFLVDEIHSEATTAEIVEMGLSEFSKPERENLQGPLTHLQL